jgi:hypothetical protein
MCATPRPHGVGSNTSTISGQRSVTIGDKAEAIIAASGSIRITTADTAWLMAECGACQAISEHSIADAAQHLVRCPKCDRRMDARKATIEAVERQVDDGAASI